ncbi:MAG: cell division protein FtsL [Candidatus Binatia bacterium]
MNAVSSKARRAESPRKPAARAARPRRRRRQSWVLPVLGLALVVVALLHVWLRLQVVHMGYVLSTTAKLQSQLEQENRELKVELATLTSPERLEEMARRRLGLTPPQRGQVIVLP